VHERSLRLPPRRGSRKAMRSSQITGKQIVVLALVTAVFAASAVLFYDRIGSKLLWRDAGAARDEQQRKVSATTIAGITDPSVASDEKNNAEVYRVMSPGVVNITSTTMVRDFFSVYPREGTGSGSIIDTEGHILTNSHVVHGAQQLDVALANDHHYKAAVVGEDPDNDLAVIKISAPKETLNSIPLGSSKELFVGQKVLAIGNPFGLDRTLTAGIVSGLSRPLRSEATGRLIEGVIQTDASINPGNSGGPLLDSHGRMIGINTMIYSPSGGSVGIGFAVPVETAKIVIPDLIANGRVMRPKLGIRPFQLDEGLANALGLPVKQGLMVVTVVEGGAADIAGIRGGTQPAQVGQNVIYLGGDVITSISGEVVKDQDDLDRILRAKKIGDKVEVEAWRNSKKMTFTVLLTEPPRRAGR
jgi:S1-C subfamily serine protease